MAIDVSEGHKEMDYDEHLRSYNLFLRGTVYGTVLAVATLVFLGLFVA